MSLFWTDPTALFWTDPAALFWSTAPSWTQTPVGGATGSFSSSAGTYSVEGTGSGVAGTSDSLYFVNQPATGNIEILANITGQTSTDPYAIAGLMLSDSLSSSDPQCAFISVSPENGVNFTSRLTDGATASTTLGPSIAAPVWLRLVVSQTSIAGFVSLDGINWQLVGMSTMTLPTDYYVGFAVGNHSGSANTATYTQVSILSSVPQRSANLVMWLRADVGVSYSGLNQVSEWADQSANGFNGVQSNASNQPTIATNVVNGLPAVSFTPGMSGQFLELPAGFADFSAGASIFIVSSPALLTSNMTILDLGNGSASDNVGVDQTSSGLSKLHVYAGSTASSISSTNSLAVDLFQLIEATYDGVDTGKLYLDGTAEGVDSSMETANVIARATNFLGQASGGSDYFDGYVAEVLVYNVLLTSGEREAVEAYLLNKWVA